MDTKILFTIGQTEQAPDVKPHLPDCLAVLLRCYTTEDTRLETSYSAIFHSAISQRNAKLTT